MAQTGPRTSTRAERSALRREQILGAAQSCFRTEGFHGASMARIASAAKMSVGHIYQYYSSKDAIIIAICERNFEGFELRLPEAGLRDEASAAALIEAWVAQFEWWLHPVRAALTLEIMAEAGRNAEVAEVVRRIDERFRSIMRTSLLPLLGGVAADEVEVRLEAMTMLAHGMTSRIAADASADPARIIAAFRLAMRELFMPPNKA
jgi:AcrR family transcriptional regulator